MVSGTVFIQVNLIGKEGESKLKAVLGLPVKSLLQCNAPHGALAPMKVLLLEETKARLAAVCQEALAGHVTGLRLADGALIQLTPVPAVPAASPHSNGELAECYDDQEWAQFENRYGKAIDSWQ